MTAAVPRHTLTSGFGVSIYLMPMERLLFQARGRHIYGLHRVVGFHNVIPLVTFRGYQGPLTGRVDNRYLVVGRAALSIAGQDRCTKWGRLIKDDRIHCSTFKRVETARRCWVTIGGRGFMWTLRTRSLPGEIYSRPSSFPSLVANDAGTANHEAPTKTWLLTTTWSSSAGPVRK